MRKRWLKMGLLALTIGGVLGYSAPVQADQTTALARAPQGVSLAQPLGVLTTATAAQNGAQVVETTNPAIVDTQAIALLSQPHQFGTAWSTAAHAFDLTHNQAVGVWVTLEAGSPALTFALQNDAQGLTVSPQSPPTIAREMAPAFAPGQSPQVVPQNGWTLDLVHLPEVGALTTGPGRWVHLTLYWRARQRTMTVTVNDRTLTTGAAQAGTSRTFPIDLNQVDPEHTGQARWGFTATTTTTTSQNVFIILDHTPGAVTARTTATLTDLTQDRRPVTAGDQVVDHDRLQLDYHLTYLGGQSDWAAVSARLRLPTNIDYQRIQIHDERGATTTVDPREITANQLVAHLTESLDRTNATATIRFLGTARAVPTTQDVTARTSTFSSTTVVTAARTPAFTVVPRHVKTVMLDLTSPQRCSLAPQQGTQVTGHVALTTSAAPLTGVVLRASLNGRQLPPPELAVDGAFHLAVAPGQLHRGLNRLTLSAVTATGNASQPRTVTLQVGGALQLLAATTTSGFAPSALTGMNQLVKRKPDWRVVVQDTRGTGHQWTLEAQATPFVTAAGKPLAGGPVYVTGNGSTPLTAIPTKIMTHTTDDRVADGITNVTSAWTPGTGVLLEVNGGTPAGTYQGMLTWTLTDAPS